MILKRKQLFSAFVLLYSIVISINVNSQIKEVDFLKGGIEDAQILFREYLRPYGNILGSNLNGGWYNTAKPHRPLGFDITITVNASWAPPSAKSFDLSALEINGHYNASSPIAPTVAGKEDDNRPELQYFMEHPVSNEDIEVARFTMPNGTGINTLPLPMAQLGIGLPFGTEITGRFLPSINIGSAGNVGLWGVGLKHSILQWIPGLKRLPVFDITAQAGYTSLITYANLNFRPENLNAQDQTTHDPLRFKNQRIDLGVEALTVNLILSQSLPVITFYQGIGYSSTNTNVALIGNFPFVSLNNSGRPVVTDNDIVTDPFSIAIQNNKNLRLNAGFRLKLGVLTIHADYTKANYGVLTTGLGISFR